MSGKTCGAALAIAFVADLIVAGCGDDGRSLNLVSSVEVQPHILSLEVGCVVAITAAVSGGEDRSVDWYVNGTLGGASGYCIFVGNTASYGRG